MGLKARRGKKYAPALPPLTRRFRPFEFTNPLYLPPNLNVIAVHGGWSPPPQPRLHRHRDHVLGCPLLVRRLRTAAERHHLKRDQQSPRGLDLVLRIVLSLMIFSWLSATSAFFKSMIGLPPWIAHSTLVTRPPKNCRPW